MKKCLEKFPEANQEIALLGVWFHDIGHYPIPTTIDHAVRGEERTKAFLQENNVDIDIINQVCHCVRSHRNKDVPPETLEAKLVAFSDSASHLVDNMYIDMIKQGNTKRVFPKLERDYRDLNLIEGMQATYTPLYEARKNLLTELMKCSDNQKTDIPQNN
jgi:hypothetical protein